MFFTIEAARCFNKLSEASGKARRKVSISFSKEISEFHKGNSATFRNSGLRRPPSLQT